MTTPTPTAMNAASPSDGDEARCWSDLVPCQKCDQIGWHVCRPSKSAAPVGQGSASSGEARPTLNLNAFQSYEDYAIYRGEIGRLHAALAAKAEQPCGGTGCRDLSCLSCGGSGDAPVAERTAAPASVPEGWKLVPVVLTREMRRVAVKARGSSNTSVDGIWWQVLKAVPEVAQPAAQGEHGSMSLQQVADRISGRGVMSPVEFRKFLNGDGVEMYPHQITALANLFATPAPTADEGDAK